MITVDVLNTFFDLICERINETKRSGRRIIYVGDCVSYTRKLFINNGLSQYNEDIYNIVQQVFIYCCYTTGMDGVGGWSDDGDYIIVN